MISVLCWELFTAVHCNAALALQQSSFGSVILWLAERYSVSVVAYAVGKVLFKMWVWYCHSVGCGSVIAWGVVMF